MDSIKISIVMFSECYIYAKTMARKNGDKLNSNHELVTFGIINTIGGILGCYPIFGSFVRSKLMAVINTNNQYFSIIGSLLCILACK
jgi:MFS superfamily sulfate permease-like transporter